MPKAFLVLSALILFALVPAPRRAFAEARMHQEAAQAPTAPTPTNPMKSSAASRERAKKIYGMDCAMCHGANGNGKTSLATDMQMTLPDWTDPATLAGKPDQELFNIIRNGKDKMPPEAKGRAKDDEVWGLILYIRGLSKGHAAAEDKPAN
jgi:mono/diheme cytochrome c family protein